MVKVWVFPLPDDPRYPHYMGNGRFGPRSDYLMRFGISQVGGEHGNSLYRWNRLLGRSRLNGKGGCRRRGRVVPTAVADYGGSRDDTCEQQRSDSVWLQRHLSRLW